MTNAHLTAARTVDDPAWKFDEDPSKAIGWAVTRAASLHNGVGIRDATTTQKARARFWTHVGLILCGAANVAPGAVLVDLRSVYGEPVPTASGS
jgi:hypothetical protein